jgi:4-hydroxy-tetrahydrodipicolinate reductase
MRLLVLGAGKTGSLVSDVAKEREHAVRVLTSAENAEARALTADFLSGYDVAIDFTTPDAVLKNIAACVRGKLPIVVGTTGWHDKVDEVRQLVQQSNAALLFGSNFSVGVNLFFEIVALRRPH